MLLVIGLAVGNVLAFASIAPLSDGIDISVVAEGMEMFGASSVLYPELQLKRRCARECCGHLAGLRCQPVPGVASVSL